MVRQLEIISVSAAGGEGEESSCGWGEGERGEGRVGTVEEGVGGEGDGEGRRLSLVVCLCCLGLIIGYFVRFRYVRSPPFLLDTVLSSDGARESEVNASNENEQSCLVPFSL